LNREDRAPDRLLVTLADPAGDAYVVLALLHALGFEVEGLDDYDTQPEGAPSPIVIPPNAWPGGPTAPGLRQVDLKPPEDL
jgi:hypothetical protein